MISLRDVRKQFPDGAWAVNGVTFDVHPGEIVVLVGASGCGKTTTLKMINRLIEATGGEIELSGNSVFDQDPMELRRQIGYVFQETGLLPHLTVGENVSIPLRITGHSKQIQQQRAAELLDLVHLSPDDYTDRYPHQLSGGQQQRVGVARALAADPRFLLMDEPFGALDTITRTALQDEFLDIQRQVAKAIVFVTHDLFEAFKLGNRIVIMNQGKIEQIGTQEELTRSPATPYIEHLLQTFRSQLEYFRS